jgi:hypothetical protein
MTIHEKTITWTYFKVDNKDMYFGCRWKKRAYKDTRRYTQQKINQDLKKLVKQQKYLDIFELSKEAKSKLTYWQVHINIPKYKDVKKSIIRKLVDKKWFRKSYIISCELKCKVIVMVW